jgi:chromosome partitioning protein
MVEISAYFDRLYELLKHDELRKALFVVLPTTAVLGFGLGRYFTARHTPQRAQMPPAPTIIDDPDCERKIAALQALIEDLRKQLAIGPEAVKRARQSVAMEGPGLWLTIDPRFPENYHVIKSGIPIYTVANLKGGVGKTTIATGLASHFVNPFGKSERKRERVLLIDLDFQGSLSSMALTTQNRIPQNAQISRATQLISGGCSGAELIRMHQPVKGIDALTNSSQIEFYAIPAYYDLARAENRLMVEWLLTDGSHDIRYNLAEILLSEDVQGRYDRIIIDAPPRLTTAHVQALAASTHVIIPAVLDQLSGEAVGSFVEQIIVHKKVWPHLKMLGIVGSMTELDQDKQLKDYERDGVLAIEQALEQKKDEYDLRADATPILPRESFIPDITELGRAAGNRIGYLSPKRDEASEKIRRVFDEFGKAVVGALGDVKEVKDLVRS